MRKMLSMMFITTSLICFISCQSDKTKEPQINKEEKNAKLIKEEKIAKLIKDEMFKTLYDFESYVPIESSKIDSAFTTVYQDSIIRNNALALCASAVVLEGLVKEAKEHQRTIEIWEDSYSNRARDKVNEAREGISNILSKAEYVIEKTEEFKKNIIEAYKDFAPTHIGWSVTHKFRCKTKGGCFDLGEYQYIFNTDLSQILYTIDLESEDEKKIKEMIDGVLETINNDNISE